MKSASPSKYQIFISSTFEDLREEREHIAWAILKLRFIPVGMESFTAKNERGWKTIQRAIDDSDYYVLILAGRYGSIDSEWQQSWTHHEYEYAISRGIPVLAFFRDWSLIPADKTDPDRTRINQFRDLIKNSYLRSSWKQKDDLATLVGTALITQINDDVGDGNARPGWYRGDALPPPSAEVTDELARLSSENANLRQEIESLRRFKEIGSRDAEIEKIVDYLRGEEIELGISIYSLFVRLSHNLALGMDHSDIEFIFRSQTQLRPARNFTPRLLSNFRMANLVKINRVEEGSGDFRQSKNMYFLTDLGAAISLDARVKNVQIPKKLTTSPTLLFSRPPSIDLASLNSVSDQGPSSTAESDNASDDQP